MKRSESQPPPSAPAVADDGDALAWTIHPMRQKPVTAVLVSIFIFIVAATVFYSTDSRAFAVLALVVLTASLAKFYFPTSYRLSDKGIMVKTTTQTLNKEWSQYRSCYPDKHGILLSPFVGPSRLENFRGLYLIFGNNREDVIAYVKAHLAVTPPEGNI